MMQISLLLMRFANLFFAFDEIGLTLMVFMVCGLDEIIIVCLEDLVET